MDKKPPEEKCVWDTPTHAILTIGKQEIEITLSRPMDPRDLPWLYQSVFNYEQLHLKGLTSNAEHNHNTDRAA